MLNYELWCLVKKVNPNAADYLWDNRDNFSVNKTNIDDLFTWSQQPQGHNYWSSLHSKLCDIDYDINRVSELGIDVRVYDDKGAI